MRKPSVQYAKSDDASIAYQVLGEGPIDLVFVPGFVSHLELAWEEPSLAWFLRSLAAFSRLILFDKRGTGLSDPVAELLTVKQRADDIAAVMDAVDVERASLLGASVGGPLCALFAAHNPERTSALILCSAFARLLWAPDYPFGWSKKKFAEFTSGAFGWEQANPSVAGDERYREWAEKYLRSAASPRMMLDLMRMNAEIDIREILPQIELPTLILARSEDALISVRHSRYMASRIPGARLVELNGMDHTPWLGDADSVLNEIETFLGVRGRRRRDRPRRGVESLTRRESEILNLASAGYRAQDIAARLSISERTAEAHISSAYLKLEIRSRIELYQRAYEFGLVGPGQSSQ